LIANRSISWTLLRPRPSSRLITPPPVDGGCSSKRRSLRRQGGSGTAALLILTAAFGGPLDASTLPAASESTKAVDNKEADVEETIGYEDLFSEEDFDSIEVGSWTESLPHSVTVMEPPGDYAGNEARYELECDVCTYVGSADDLEQARALAVLHEHFAAVPVQDWSVE
jgi:hypothetical protein